MNKEEIVRHLTSIANEIICLNKEDFEKKFVNETFEVVFDRFCWREPAKIVTTINMRKVMLAEK